MPFRKEEKFLFPALEEAGLKKEDGPLDELILEHALSREIVLRMQKTISCNTIETYRFIQTSESYIDLLRNHIKKENNILYPIADVLLSQAKQTELMENFADFEDNEIGRGKHLQLHQTLESFELKYLARESV